MRSVQMNLLGLTLLFACVLSLGLMNPGLVLAGQPKVDVCHFEGNGSYHRITIAAPAYPSHVAHGDAGVGEPVPGNEGLEFDEECNVVTTGVCICLGMESLGLTFDDSFAAVACSESGNYVRSVFDAAGNSLKYVQVATDSAFCEWHVDNSSDNIFLSGDELPACEALIRQIAFNDGVSCP